MSKIAKRLCEHGAEDNGIMRVIAGCARGTVLFQPDGESTRPTANRIKEDLFNIIAPYVRDASFLDLYAGTGQMGIEALSRGAQRAVFVEASKAAADLVRKNLAKCRMETNIVICDEALRAAQNLARQQERFDIVFIDPPYDIGGMDKVIRAMIDGNMLNNGALVITEQASSAQEATYTPALEVYKVKKYTTAKITFMKYTSNNTE